MNTIGLIIRLYELIPAKLLDYDIWHGRRRQSVSTRYSPGSTPRGDSDEIEVCTFDGGCDHTTQHRTAIWWQRSHRPIRTYSPQRADAESRLLSGLDVLLPTSRSDMQLWFLRLPGYLGSDMISDPIPDLDLIG